ncbi:MAG: DUF1795 domain-containing protein, partial [Candidatus Obscuribacterales bacterium]|nr:DUF1795 domain-containing protein [Candidatus Obscuribacterales bacterium]
ANPAKKSPATAHQLESVTGSQTRLATWSKEGLAFSYPASWKRSEDKDKNTLVKYSGRINNDYLSEVKLARHDDPEMKAEPLKSIIDAIYLAKLPAFKKIEEKTINFGKNRNIKGQLEDVSFELNGMKIIQRYVFFDAPDGAYTFSFTSPAAQFVKTVPTINQILLSFTTVGGNSSPVSRTSSTTSYFSSKSLPVSLGYPANWSISETEEYDHPLKITGKNDNGQPVEINMHEGDMPPYYSIEQVADELEKKFYANQKNFRRVSRCQKNFGANSHVPGLIQENSFQYKGTPVKQLVAFFEHNGKAFAVSMLSPGWKESEMHHIFNKMLATIKLRD